MLAKVNKSGNPIHDALWKYAINVCILFSNHVTKALWIEGVRSWADHIQVIHSQGPNLWSMKMLGQPEKKLQMKEILADDKSMFERWRGWLFIPSYEGICVGFWRFPMEFPKLLNGELREPFGNLQKSHTNALLQPVKFHFISRLVIRRASSW
jgi:hypothetical protein